MYSGRVDGGYIGTRMGSYNRLMRGIPLLFHFF
jgi:hypothetical protein